MKNLIENYRFVYDGTMDDDSNIIYTFASDELSLEESSQLFYDLYEEDIEEYVQDHIEFNEDYDINGCSIYIYVDKETGEVQEDFITLQPTITYSDGKIVELLGAFIELDYEIIEQLLELTKNY